jgi:uncharacterized MnhB-related membrane protein
MQELEANWPRVFAVWWLVVWRTLLGGLVLGFGAGFLIGLVGALLGAPSDALTALSAIVGWLLSLAWGVVVVRMALRKQYGEFRLALIPRSAG